MQVKNTKDYIVLRSNEWKSAEKVAAFDLDGTLIETKSGRKFPKDKDDWQFRSVGGLSKVLSKDNWCVVIFTNQAGISRSKGMERQKRADMILKIKKIQETFGVPLFVIIAPRRNVYRKPSAAMWHLFVQTANIKNIKEAFYVGDAAGRARDFSDSDRQFVYNINLTSSTNSALAGIQMKFHTPEEFFFKEKKVDIEFKGFEPQSVLSMPDTLEYPLPAVAQYMILMVGPPASGKSTVARALKGDNCEIVSRDICKTQDKCIKMTKMFLTAGKSVIIDNTNAAILDRKRYIDEANAVGIPVYAYVMRTPRPLVMHLNLFREQLKFYKHGAGKPRIPKIAYSVHYKRFEMPTENEGFADVHKIKWRPVFADQSMKKIFLQHLC